MGVLITPMALAHPLHPIKGRSRNKRRNLWVGWCVSSWRPWFWHVHSIYYIHTKHYSRILTNWNILFLRAIPTKSWYGHAGVLDDLILSGFRAPSQYPKRRLSVRSRKVSKPRDLYLELSDRSEIWQVLRQQCCRCASQISKRYDNLKYQSRGFETLRDLTKRRLFGYWDGAQVAFSCYVPYQLTKKYLEFREPDRTPTPIIQAEINLHVHFVTCILIILTWILRHWSS